MKEDQIEKYHYLKDSPTKRQFDIFDLAEYYSENAEHASHPHTHSFFQIIWFKSNTGKHFVDFKDFDIQENSLFFIAKDQVHYFEDNADYEGLLIHFNESFILSSDTDINFFLTYSIFNHNTEPFFQIPEMLLTQITAYFTQIAFESKNSEKFGNAPILSHLLKSLLLTVEREKRKGIDYSTEASYKNSTFLEFRNLLELNFHQNWSVSDYAEKLSVSTKTLNTITKSQVDKTVSQVIVDRIILESKRKLTHSNAYVNQIAFDLGFKDPYYFIRYFTKHVKCSPNEFRKSIS